MKQGQRQKREDNAWVKIPYANLVCYAPSGTYYARLRVRGKLIVRSLKTDRITVAKLRLADLDKQEREKAEDKVDVRKALANGCAALAIPKITHHDLRHLFANRCIECGIDIPTISRWLGHRDGAALAMRVYGHPRDTHSQTMAMRASFSNVEPENVVQMPAEAHAST